MLIFVLDLRQSHLRTPTRLLNKIKWDMVTVLVKSYFSDFKVSAGRRRLVAIGSIR